VLWGKNGQEGLIFMYQGLEYQMPEKNLILITFGHQTMPSFTA